MAEEDKKISELNGGVTVPPQSGDKFPMERGGLNFPVDYDDLVGPTGPTGETGDRGETGDAGANGWSPVFAAASDGARRVLRVVDWTGGTGTKPATGKYVGASGLVDAIEDGVDVRGPEGASGGDAPALWYAATGDTPKVSRAGEIINLAGLGKSGTYDISGDEVVTEVYANSNSIVSANLSGCSALKIAYLNTNAMTDIDLTGCAAITDLDVNSNDLAAIDLSDLTALINVGLGHNSIGALDITGLTALLSADFTDNALDESSVDGVLVALDGFGLSGGYVGLAAGTNAIPSAVGLAAKANLEGKGWTVEVNE